MKKLLAIIGVLLIIFIVMCISKNNKSQISVNAAEVKEIEKYISKIYMWKEITEQALPEFDNINNAPELWLWEVVKKNLEEYELTAEQINEKAKEIFGENLEKTLPKEGTEYIIFNEENGKYYTTGIGLDIEEDLFFINKIEKNSEGFKVEILEYLADYEESANIEDGEEYNINIKNLNNETIEIIKNTESESKVIEIIKENMDKFSKKIIYLKQSQQGNFYVEKIEK